MQTGETHVLWAGAVIAAAIFAFIIGRNVGAGDEAEAWRLFIHRAELPQSCTARLEEQAALDAYIANDVEPSEGRW